MIDDITMEITIPVRNPIKKHIFSCKLNSCCVCLFIEFGGFVLLAGNKEAKSSRIRAD